MDYSIIPDYYENAEAEAEALVFAGITLNEYDVYVKRFLQNEAKGFSNMKLSDAFYKPMLEVVSYLQKNDFKVYICSGSDRFWVRAAVDGKINIPKEQIIGMDCLVVSSGQDGKDGLDYVYKYSDEPVRSDKLIIKNVKMNKVSQITQEIGRQPVLVFGNSTGDSSMCAYVIDDNPYRSLAFITISMKDDWSIIYNLDVV